MEGNENSDDGSYSFEKAGEADKCNNITAVLTIESYLSSTPKKVRKVSSLECPGKLWEAALRTMTAYLVPCM